MEALPRTKFVLVNCIANPSHATIDGSQDRNIGVLEQCENIDFEGVESEKREAIDYIKCMLSTMDDGRISVSAYDTAWVGLIPDINGSGSSPQFPSSLEWIAENQLSDGSWGEPGLFSAYDRLVNTLACVIALKTWKVHSGRSEKGITFIKENMCKLERAYAENMTCGFELVFPALLEKARNLGIELPYDDSPALKEIYATRALKLTRIPKEVMHTVPTALLFNLEGLQDLDWVKLLKLQTPPGSFLTSPASTAFAVMETKDQDSLRHLEEIVAKFNGGAPTNFPVDLYARLFAVDRLQRLGISHYFQSEIKECLDYVNRYWTENGVFCARNSKFYDIDDTAMGFRLLRLHGYNVIPDVFRNFKDGDQFCCYQGQISESPSPIFNLYRASQVLFPGEKILEDANSFSYKFLKERLDKNQLLDKWLIAKDLAGEVRYGLEVPWYASLPRVETRFYIEQYGGADDVWIGKSLYRMPEINNHVYLDLARSDFNTCQAQHQMEWNNMVMKWYRKYNLQEYGISENILLLAYFLAATNKFEPEKMIDRLAWAKSLVISSAIKSYLLGEAIYPDQRITLIKEFKNHLNGPGKTNGNKSTIQALQSILVEFLHQLSTDSFKRMGRDISHQLHDAWEMWLTGLNGETSDYQEEAELLVRTINLCSGYIGDSMEILSQIEYKRLADLTNKICHKLKDRENKKAIEDDNFQVHDMERLDLNTGKDVEIESDFQALVQLVFENSSVDGLSTRDIRQTFLAVAKTYYYTAYCSQETIDVHISKVLFEPVL